MSDSPALDSFLLKWRERWPEWPLAERFVPARQRGLAVAWFALLQEFEDAFNIAGDPLPADVKLRWWREELHAWQSRRSRHPLGRTLETVTAAWSDLAQSLEDFPEARAQAQDIDTVWTCLRRHAQAVATVEAVLFPNAAPVEDAVEGIVAQTLAMRCMSLIAPIVPAESLEGSEDETASENQANQLLRRWPPHAGTLPRRVRSVLVWQRLRRFAAGSRKYANGSLPMLWRVWNAARRQDR